jgi:hypothetical protein
MIVKVLYPFYDINKCVNRHVGETFEADKTRIAEIKKVNADLIEVVEEEKQTEKKTTKRSKKENA